MKFICLIDSTTTPHNEECLSCLKESARELGLQMVMLAGENLDSSDLIAENWDTSDIFYRVAINKQAKGLEGVILDQPGAPKSLYYPKTNFGLMSYPWRGAFRMERADLPVVPSRYFLRQMRDTELQAVVDSLGGFPIVLKRTGLTHGAGVQLVSTLAELQHILGQLNEAERPLYALRRYIHNYRHARLIVLGEQVIGSLEYFRPDNDFRTNAVAEPNVRPQRFNTAIEQLAIRAVKVREVYFGGVDILIGEDKSPYIAEVNFPCNFARYQLNTGDDVSTQVLKFLQEL